ncbi:MAG TPA: hypothetical protein VHV83_22595 [Armatimonadota bacterium]|nr:hypothetical protein [Armatimonadota bacterium]
MCIIRHTVVSLLIFWGAWAAMGQPLSPVYPTEFQTSGNSKWTIGPTSNLAALSWEGRSLSLFEVGIEAKNRKQFTLGACMRNSSGHGHDSANSYDADGWRVYGEVPVFIAHKSAFTYSLFGEYVSDDAQLDISTTNSRAITEAGATNAGVGLRACANRGKAVWHAQTGLYCSTVDEDTSANTACLGGGVSVLFGHHISGFLDITGYREDYLDKHTAMEIEGTLKLLQSSWGSLTVGGHFFPYGIPMGGSAFSTTSSMGLVYGQSAAAKLRDNAMGYLTLAGEITF